MRTGEISRDAGLSSWEGVCFNRHMPRFTGFSPVPIRGPRALPFFGPQAAFLRLLADPVGRTMALHSRYGDVVAAADRCPAVVAVFGAERNREVLSTTAVFDNDGEFLLKPPAGSFLEQLSRGLLFQTGEGHRRHRRLMMPAFQKAAIDGHAPEIVGVTSKVLETWPVGQTADVAALTRELVQHVAVWCLFGLDDTSGDHGLGRVAGEVVDLLTSPLTVALPFAFPGGPYSRLLEVSAELVRLLRELLEEKRRTSAGGKDALALMLRAHDEDHSPFGDDELFGEMVTLFVAGHDTQARTLAWTLFLLGQHPKVLADVLDEIDGVLRGGPPTLSHVPRLVLVDRVLKESMRVLAPVPILFLKVAQTDTHLGSYTVPRGTNVVVCPFVTHRDPERFPEPRRFKPERWERLQPTIYEYLPFGAGPRMCIGAAFATLTMRLILPMILQRYRMTLAYGARVSRIVRGNILAPRYGLPMLIAPQDRRLVRREHVRGDIPEVVDLSRD